MMKNLTFANIAFCLIAILGLASCSEDLPLGGVPSGKDGIVASISQVQNAKTRAALIDAPGIGIYTCWEENDAIGLFGEGGSNAHFVVDKKRISGDRASATFISAEPIPEGEILAYYPYQADASAGGSETLTLTIPATQQAGEKSGVCPDGRANLMLGKGSRENGLTFCNVMALLKFSEKFDEDKRIMGIDFSDLSGTPVAGQATVNWNEGNPILSVTGSEKVIHLDCGEGVFSEAGTAQTFYLFVPAREYSQGFQITFTFDDGKQTSRIIGSKMGKTLERNTVYPLGEELHAGEITSDDIHTELMPNARLIKAEDLDKIQVLQVSSKWLSGLNGETLKNEVDGKLEVVQGAVLDLLVHKDLKPVKDGWFILNNASALMPGGGTLRITGCTPCDDERYFVHAETEANPFSAFKEVSIGSPTYTADGQLIEDGGMPMGVMQHLQKVVDKDGHEIPFALTDDGGLILHDSVINSVLAQEAMKGKKRLSTTKVFNYNMSLGSIKKTFSYKKVELTTGIRLDVDVRFGMNVLDGELQWLNFTARPKATFTGELSVEGEVRIEQRLHLLKLVFGPIVAGGIVITPTCDFEIGAFASATLVCKMDMEFTQELGALGFSYQKNSGFNARKHEVDDSSKQGEAQVTSPTVEGTLAVGVLASAKPRLSFYGLFSCGVDADAELALSLSATTFPLTGKVRAPKLALTPSISFTPVTASLGGVLSKHWEEYQLKLEFDPIWERYLYPNVAERQTIQLQHNFASPPLGKDSVACAGGFGGWYYTPASEILGVTYHIPIVNSCGEDYTVAVEEYRGTGVDFYPYKWDNELYHLNFGFFRTNGIPQFFPDAKRALRNPQLEAVHEVGVFKAGTEGQLFEGSLPIKFSNNVFYGLLPVLYEKDKGVIVRRIPLFSEQYVTSYLTGPNTWGYFEDKTVRCDLDLIWCTWPYDLNGNEVEIRKALH